MKKHTDLISLPLIIENILLKESDMNHLVSMDDINILLEEDYGITVDRRSVYKAIRALNENGRTVIYERKDGTKGYRIEHVLSSSEALIFLNAIQEAPGLSVSTTESLHDKIRPMLSVYEEKTLTEFYGNPNKTDNNNVVANIQLLLDAINKNNIVEFSYYDMTITSSRRYRRKNHRYHLEPYAIVSYGGRYYCIFHDASHDSFANYRIDKMDRIINTDIEFTRIPFHLESHLNASFQMYHGRGESIILEVDHSLEGIVFEQFGKNIIVTKNEEESFTVSIRSAVTPTLISWILMFEDKITVIKPASLIKEITRLADNIHKKYKK